MGCWWRQRWLHQGADQLPFPALLQRAEEETFLCSRSAKPARGEGSLLHVSCSPSYISNFKGCGRLTIRSSLFVLGAAGALPAAGPLESSSLCMSGAQLLFGSADGAGSSSKEQMSGCCCSLALELQAAQAPSSLPPSAQPRLGSARLGSARAWAQSWRGSPACPLTATD